MLINRLDIGEGKEVNLDRCPRNKLQSQCVKYLGPKERQEYEVVVESGRLVYKQSGVFVHTSDDSKWIFVLSTTKALYVGQVTEKFPAHFPANLYSHRHADKPRYRCQFPYHVGTIL
jgi:hypothetical protein